MADYSNIFKVWGTRKRILLTDTCEIDLLHVFDDSFCSTHSHKYKINKFVVLSGKIRIETEYGYITLKEGDQFEVRPPLKHRFFAEEHTDMIELAYVEKGKINPNDIDRESQGGRVINGEEITLDKMREEGLLDL
jgi:mannose-6-phosphate isomerase-like protein (cupin superfamily)